MQNPCSLLHLVSWNNLTHLGMQAIKEQYDCEIEAFTITEYKERQTKNRQGEEGSTKWARKYNNKKWKTGGGKPDPYRSFIEYVSHRS